MQGQGKTHPERRPARRKAARSKHPTPSSRRRTIRVMVADDHPLVRRGIIAMLADNHRISVVGEVGDGRRIVEECLRLKPDVVLMDLQMPGLDGCTATALLRSRAPAARILFFSGHCAEDDVIRMIRAGAHGCISKGSSPETLMRGIERVARGESCFDATAAQSFVQDFIAHPAGEARSSGPRLSPRESEVLSLLSTGMANKEIASSLGVGVRTVETHRERLKRKLGIRSVAELTRFAMVHPFVSKG